MTLHLQGLYGFVYCCHSVSRLGALSRFRLNLTLTSRTVRVMMAASLPQKPGMAGMPPQQQQQQQQPHLPPSAASAQGQQAMPPQGALREISPVFLCRIGQETVQDIVTRTMEIFQITRATQVLDITLLLSRRSPPSLCEVLLLFCKHQHTDCG